MGTELIGFLSNLSDMGSPALASLNGDTAGFKAHLEYFD